MRIFSFFKRKKPAVCGICNDTIKDPNLKKRDDSICRKCWTIEVFLRENHPDDMTWEEAKHIMEE